MADNRVIIGENKNKNKKRIVETEEYKKHFGQV